MAKQPRSVYLVEHASADGGLDMRPWLDKPEATKHLASMSSCRNCKLIEFKEVVPQKKPSGLKPLTWKAKKTGKTFRVMPWWEVLPDDEIANEKLMAAGDNHGRKWKFGMLVQVGWLLENEHGIWFGVGLSAAEQFTEVKPKKRKK